MNSVTSVFYLKKYYLKKKKTFARNSFKLSFIFYHKYYGPKFPAAGESLRINLA